MLFLVYVNVSGICLFSCFASHGTGSLDCLPCWVVYHLVYHPLGSTLVAASHFLAGNGEAELKPTTFSSLLFFSFSLYLLSSPFSFHFLALQF